MPPIEQTSTTLHLPVLQLAKCEPFRHTASRLHSAAVAIIYIRGYIHCTVSQSAFATHPNRQCAEKSEATLWRDSRTHLPHIIRTPRANRRQQLQAYIQARSPDTFTWHRPYRCTALYLPVENAAPMTARRGTQSVYLPTCQPPAKHDRMRNSRFRTCAVAHAQLKYFYSSFNK